MRVPFLFSFMMMATFSVPACAQETEIENDVPISAEATTSVVPGKEADVAAETAAPTAIAAPAKPYRIYTDGALADPTPKAEDLGLASPGDKTVIDSE